MTRKASPTSKEKRLGFPCAPSPKGQRVTVTSRCLVPPHQPHSCLVAAEQGAETCKGLVGPKAVQMYLLQSALRHEGNKGTALTQPRLDPPDANGRGF